MVQLGMHISANAAGDNAGAEQTSARRRQRGTFGPAACGALLVRAVIETHCEAGATEYLRRAETDATRDTSVAMLRS